MSKQLNFHVTGTKCASCEVLLERELKSIQGVQVVNASHPANRVTLTVDDGVSLNPQDLERVVGAHGYRFRSAHATADTPVSETPRMSYKRLGGVAVLVLALYLLLKNTGFLTFAPDVDATAGLGAVFVIGLIAAFSSCTAVVSGLVAAVSSKAAACQATLPLSERLRPHLLFNAGRLVGFAGFGALIGLLGKGISLSPGMNAILVIGIAVLMIGLGVNLLNVLPKQVVQIRPPKWLSHKIHDLAESKHPLVPFALGAFTFFLPCGFTQSMQLYAMTTGDPITAATVMLVFALGTVPALLGVGVVASSAKGRSLRYLTQAAGALVLVLGISNLGNGASLLGWNVGGSVRASTTQSAPVIVGNEQVVQMEVTPYAAYSPEVLTVVEDVPVRWEIFGSKSMGCASSLVMRAFNISTRLKPGMNVVTFTPTEPGRYAFSCSMGMVRGTMIVEPRT